MKTLQATLILAIFLATGDRARAELTNRYESIVTLDGTRYENARPTRQEGKAIVLIHSKGISAILISALPTNVVADFMSAQKAELFSMAKELPPSTPVPRLPETVDLPSLYGDSREELRNVRFPADLGLVRYYFTDMGCLAQLTFTPGSPITIDEAEALMKQKCSVTLVSKCRVSNRFTHAYRNMSGLIRTVNFEMAESGATSSRITAMSVFFNLDWAETRGEGIDRIKLNFQH